MAWFFGNKQQKYIDNLEKNNKKRQEKEREEAEIITIGKATPEQQEERASQVVAQRNQKRMEAIEEEQEKEDKAQEDQLFVINGAKVKFGPHIGTFKVLSDTPTIQSKTVGTQIENAPLNFTFEDGFQLLTLTQWQDVGDAKFQGNVALIKKSTIVSTGKMSPANAPIESGKIEFIDSGQINVPENIDTTGMPMPLFNQTIEESEYFLESNYFYNHLLEVAKEVISSIDEPESYVYKFYKKIIEGQIKNPEIKVVKNLFSDKWGKYDTFSGKIQISEKQLIEIEKDNDRKIQLITVLGDCYAKYIEEVVENLIDDTSILDLFEYEFLRFDGFGDTCNIPIAKLTTPQKDIHILNICLEVPEEILQEEKTKKKYYDKIISELPPLEPRRGYSDNLSLEDDSILPPPPDNNPFPNMGLKFTLTWKGALPAYSISIYAGIQKKIGELDGYSNTAAVNASVTFYHNTPGTSYLSPNLFTLSISPTFILGYKTGNTLSFDSFNQYSGTGISIIDKYALSIGVTGVLSTGRVFDNNPKYETDEGNKISYNSWDVKHRHQLLGTIGVKIDGFGISSYNDAFKGIPLFLGQNSDQYWSAGIHILARVHNLLAKYSVDMYYGKSNNELPYNLDKEINGQNYDNQSVENLILNRGEMKVIIYDINRGYLMAGSEYGNQTFWFSNKAHNGIPSPDFPKLKKNETFDFLNKRRENFLKSKFLNPKGTFHHLKVVYKKDGSIDFNELKEYEEAPIIEEKLPKGIEPFFK